MKIPIANIYYLLAYAWDKLQETRQVSVRAEDCATPVDLLGRILVNGTAYLFKKGLDRNYREYESIIPGIKGKLLVGESVKKATFQYGRAVCQYDEFDYDVLHNQLLKATLKRLHYVKDLDSKLKGEAWQLCQRFHEVSEIQLRKSLFGKVRLHRNNRFYGFLLKVCELLYDNLLPDEQPGKYRFKEFWKDEKQMPHLFESFVSNFYKQELPSNYRVKRDDIQWQLYTQDEFAQSRLPKMQTDVTIYTPEKKIIIEAKYNKDIFTWNFSNEKIRSQHLYQLHAYLTQQVNPADLRSQNTTGILLYATAGQSINHTYSYPQGHHLSLRTIDLLKDWKDIRDVLLETVDL